ncbi:MAG: NAD(P)-binding protein [Candidatus Aenigmarchaeota archaeon]|nr:NAD(P)-binding protein [Candidatus Aenigmarchaeota archaeon]
MKAGILGGGLTGLTIGTHLNHDFEILEKNKECGGLCRSITDQGFTFDLGGGHIIFSRDNDILEFMKSLVKDNIIENKRNTKILHKGRYVKYPFENGIGELPEEDALHCLTHFLSAANDKKAGKHTPPSNFEEWMYQTFGKGIAEMYLIPYNKKIWNFEPSKMAVDWVIDRIPQPPVEDIIKSFLKIETEGYTHQLNFFYPRDGGIASTVNHLESKISEKIKKNINITKIEKKDKWIVHHDNGVEKYDKLISTIPVMELLGYMDDVPEDVMKAANDLKYNSLINVLIGVNKSKINDFHWTYIHEEDVKFNRLIFLSNYSPNVTPENKSSIAVEFTCNFNDEMWNKSDDEIINHVLSGLERKGIVNAEDICYSKVVKSKYAYVIYDLDYKKNIEKVLNFLESKGIEMCGRFSEFKYMNMDACIKSAMKMANKINGV